MSHRQVVGRKFVQHYHLSCQVWPVKTRVTAAHSTARLGSPSPAPGTNGSSLRERVSAFVASFAGLFRWCWLGCGGTRARWFLVRRNHSSSYSPTYSITHYSQYVSCSTTYLRHQLTFNQDSPLSSDFPSPECLVSSGHIKWCVDAAPYSIWFRLRCHGVYGAWWIPLTRQCSVQRISPSASNSERRERL